MKHSPFIQPQWLFTLLLVNCGGSPGSPSDTDAAPSTGNAPTSNSTTIASSSQGSSAEGSTTGSTASTTTADSDGDSDSTSGLADSSSTQNEQPPYVCQGWDLEFEEIGAATAIPRLLSFGPDDSLFFGVGHYPPGNDHLITLHSVSREGDVNWEHTITPPEGGVLDLNHDFNAHANPNSGAVVMYQHDFPDHKVLQIQAFDADGAVTWEQAIDHYDGFVDEADIGGCQILQCPVPGQIDWQVAALAATSDGGYALAVVPSHVPSFLTTLDANGEFGSSVSITRPGALEVIDDVLFLGGSTMLGYQGKQVVGGFDAFVSRYEEFDHDWTRLDGNKGDEFSIGVAILTDGRVASLNTRDDRAYVVVYNANGIVDMSRTIPTLGPERATSFSVIEALDDGGFLIGGSTNGTWDDESFGGHDGLVLRFDAKKSLANMGARQFGGFGDDRIEGLVSTEGRLNVLLEVRQNGVTTTRLVEQCSLPTIAQ